MIKSLFKFQVKNFSRKIQKLTKLKNNKKDFEEETDSFSVLKKIDSTKPQIINDIDKNNNEEYIPLYKNNDLIANQKEKEELEQKLEKFLHFEEVKEKERKNNEKMVFKKIEKQKPEIFLNKTKLFQKNELAELLEDRHLKINKLNRKDISEMGFDTKLDLKMKNPSQYPIPSNYKIYLFHKPSKLICDTVDPKKRDRMTIFQFIEIKYNIKEPLYCCVN